jgi:molybdate transport system substrate-binding protein
LTLHLLSGGAAQGLVNALAPQFKAETGCVIDGRFGAVGDMTAKLRAGAPADLVVLTAALVSELARDGNVVAGSAADLGAVATGVAVRDGDSTPVVDDVDALRAALVAADAIYFPDPKLATAGIHFAKVLDRLGLARAVEARLRTFPNGASAMRALAAAPEAKPIGCTQVTEILNTPGVTLLAPLPRGLALETVYTVGVCTRAPSPDLAQRFAALLTGARTRPLRQRLGFTSA